MGSTGSLAAGTALRQGFRERPAGQREDVFRPFFRLDAARNQDAGGTGLGLSIARDIARTHGGDIALDDSPMGGLRAIIRVPA